MTAAVCGAALAVVLVVLPAFLRFSRRRPVARAFRSPEPRPPLPMVSLTSALAALAALSSWRRFKECRDAGRHEDGAMYRDQARWRARLAAKLRARDADDSAGA